MKILILVAAALFMVGCSTNVTRDVVEVKVPVYTKPKIQKTQRPELISDKVNSTKYDEVVKAVKVDLESLKTYSFILENQLNAIVEYEE